MSIPSPRLPFHSTDPSNQTYSSTSTSPTQLSTLNIPRLGSLNDDTTSNGTPKLRSDVTVNDLVKSDIFGKRKRLSVGDRLKKLRKDFGKLGKSDKDHVASTPETSTLAASRTVPDRIQNSTRHNYLKIVPDACTDGSASLQFGQVPSCTQEQFEPEPEATTLAREIQHLVDSLPLPQSPNPSNPIISPNPTLQASSPKRTLSLSSKTPLPAPTDGSPEPQPQPQIKNSRLIALLSNASFMNGSSLKGKPSIWNVLENIHSGPNLNRTSSHLDPTLSISRESQPLKEDDERQQQPAPLPPSNMYHNQILNESSPSMVFSDTSSIMVYSPLFPTQSDSVELAELVPFDAETGETEIQTEDVGSGFDSKVVVSENVGRDSQEAHGGATWTSMWPFSIWYGPDQTQQSGSNISSQTHSSPTTTNGIATGSSGPGIESEDFTTFPQVGNIDIGGLPITTTNQRIRSVKSTRAWVPSPSKISVQAFWWGYRLYLPPPILEILSDQTLEATKRSAVITTALTWFFNNLPIDVFPPPIKPGLILLQRLVPLLGYIGTFISWSWNTIRSYDVGYGVTLTATWILPVALIPGTWYERDFPKSPTPNSHIPLPRPFSMQSFVPPTPTTPTTDMSTYATPMSSVVPLLPDGVNEGLDPSSSSLASSSLSCSSSAPLPPRLPISSPIYCPTIPPNSPSSLCFTPNSPTEPVYPHHSGQLQTSLPVPLDPNLNSFSVKSSPRIRTPRFSTRMRSSSPSINTSNGSDNGTVLLPLIIHNIIPPSSSSPISTSIENTNLYSTQTPIPIPPTPIELPPIPPEFPLNPKLVNQLLCGPVLQTVPLPDVG